MTDDATAVLARSERHYDGVTRTVARACAARLIRRLDVVDVATAYVGEGE